MSNTRKAKPQGELDLDALIAETHNAPFVFTFDGEKHELPHLQNLTTDEVDALSEDYTAELPKYLRADVVEKLLKLPVFALKAIIDGWAQHSGADLGEGKASGRS